MQLNFQRDPEETLSTWPRNEQMSFQLLRMQDTLKSIGCLFLWLM